MLKEIRSILASDKTFEIMKFSDESFKERLIQYANNNPDYYDSFYALLLIEINQLEFGHEKVSILNNDINSHIANAIKYAKILAASHDLRGYLRLAHSFVNNKITIDVTSGKKHAITYLKFALECIGKSISNETLSNLSFWRLIEFTLPYMASLFKELDYEIIAKLSSEDLRYLSENTASVLRDKYGNDVEIMELLKTRDLIHIFSTDLHAISILEQISRSKLINILSSEKDFDRDFDKTQAFNCILNKSTFDTLMNAYKNDFDEVLQLTPEKQEEILSGSETLSF